MQPSFNIQNQRGFSLLETMIAVTVMLIATAAVFSLMRDTMKIATATYELTDAQESLRTAQEYVNRDLMNAGDGLKSLSVIRVPSGFVTNYLSLTPITEAAMPTGVINLGLITSDNNVPAATVVTGSSPAETVRTGTDRQTILQIDPDPLNTPIALAANKINSNGTVITVPSGDIGRFAVGEIWFLSSALGGTFGTITATDTSAKTLTFSSGDTYGLNLTAAADIKAIASSGTIATTLQRMRIIHYYVNSGGFLMRRVFGVKSGGFTESMIAEHVLNVQFNYALSLTDSNGYVVQPTTTLSTSDERINVRQVEVTVTVETPHSALPNGSKPQLSGTTSTSVRNMQFRRSLQPD